MTRHSRKRGFSLIEAAIVLAVVGLVIGGIWVVASAVSYQYQKQRFFQGFLTIRSLTAKYLSQSLNCASYGLYAGMGGSFMKYDHPNLYQLLIPNQWKTEIKFSRFIRFAVNTMHTQIVCDSSDTRYYNIAMFFASKSICYETYDYLKARGFLVGQSGTANQNRCSVGNGYFDVVYEIPRRS